MLPKIIEIARLYLFTTFKDRSALIFGLLVPLIFTFVLGEATGAAFGGDGPSQWSIAVVNEDAGSQGAVLFGLLEDDPALAVSEADREASLQMVEDEEVVAAVIIRSNFSANISSGENSVLHLAVNQSSVQQGQLIEQAISQVTARLYAEIAAVDASAGIADRLGLFQGDGEERRATYVAAAQERANAAWQAPPVELRVQQETRIENNQDQIPVGMQQSAPATLVLFSMFFVLGGTAVLVQERVEGTLRRLIVLPLRRSTILSGKLLGVYISGVLQIGLLIILGQVLFGVRWGQSPLALIALVLCFAFAITSLGMLVAALVKTLAQANSLPTVIVLPMAALGGAMWPIEITPLWMQRIGHLFPTAWAIDGFNDILTRGLGLPDVLLECGVLGLYGIAFLALGVWRFKYE